MRAEQTILELFIQASFDRESVLYIPVKGYSRPRIAVKKNKRLRKAEIFRLP
jgi:hypothetical protein